jgi:FtsP/CotA-like multicopper oxidase with cupredoxin domain
MTAVHWHGMELESPYDGVAGLSGVHPSIEAPIMPGDSFAALMTPPRAGTFIYHTHIDDIYQQINGLYGPLIVLDSARRWNPDTDRVFLMSDAGLQVALNGAHTPLPVTLTTGVRYRMRVINITALNPFLSVTLTHNGALVPWHFVAKDGATLPPAQAVTVDAAQRVSIGETYDYEVQRADTGTLVFSVLRANGTVVLSQLLHFASPVH